MPHLARSHLICRRFRGHAREAHARGVPPAAATHAFLTCIAEYHHQCIAHAKLHNHSLTMCRNMGRTLAVSLLAPLPRLQLALPCHRLLFFLALRTCNELQLDLRRVVDHSSAAVLLWRPLPLPLPLPLPAVHRCRQTSAVKATRQPSERPGSTWIA